MNYTFLEMLDKFIAILCCFPLFGSRLNHDDYQREYVTVRLMGQFGNQLFQIATAYAYSLDHGLGLMVPSLVLDSSSGIPHNAKSVFLHKISAQIPILSTPVWSEPSFNYCAIPDYNRVELRGYFQSEKYFAHRREEILELFAAPDGFNERILTKYPFLASELLSVAVQIRDYRVDAPTGAYHPTLGRSYYERTMALFPEDAIFLVSSNNREFAKQCVEGLAQNIIYLDADYIEEFYTLVLCKSFIISNSTFGWWAAWLSRGKDKRVIAPTPWFAPPYDTAMEKDLIPPSFQIMMSY